MILSLLFIPKKILFRFVLASGEISGPFEGLSLHSFKNNESGHEDIFARY